MQKNIVFRGCTRPATFLGVPYIPFFIGAGSGLLMGMYFNMFFLLTIPFIILIMRQMAKRDDMIFRFLVCALNSNSKQNIRKNFRICGVFHQMIIVIRPNKIIRFVAITQQTG